MTSIKKKLYPSLTASCSTASAVERSMPAAQSIGLTARLPLGKRYARPVESAARTSNGSANGPALSGSPGTGNTSQHFLCRCCNGSLTGTSILGKGYKMVSSNTSKSRKTAQTVADDHKEVQQHFDMKFDTLLPTLTNGIEQLQASIYNWNAYQGFWADDNTGSKIALMHSELSEALEADRKDLPSEVLPEGFSGVEEELADCIIRILDFAGRHDLDLAGALYHKLHFNLSRPYRHEKKF